MLHIYCNEVRKHDQFLLELLLLSNPYYTEIPNYASAQMIAELKPLT